MSPGRRGRRPSLEVPLGTRISVALVDPVNGSAVEVIGDVVREATAPSWTLGILLIEPAIEWHALVAAAAHRSVPEHTKPAKRLRVLVFGDDHRQRGAMALYVTSGWDVLFASTFPICSPRTRRGRPQ